MQTCSPTRTQARARESDIIHETLQGQHRLSQPLDCRVTFQAPTASANNSAGKAKSERCRTADAGRLMANTTLMIYLQTVEQQVAQSLLGPCMREVEDPTSNHVYEDPGQIREQAQVNSQSGLLSTLVGQ